jgi:serine/threonine protein kinase
MSSLSDEALERLRRVADWPEFAPGRYRAVELLGSGGMGSVYLADDRELDRQVAVKVLSVIDPDGSAAARMMQEARILGRLEHPGIVPVHDVGTLPDGRCFYVMKRVRGERLDRHVAIARPVSDLLRIFERACETVAFAHARGVVHRDLKPDNVMVGEFGEVLVLDWGVAKLLDAASAAGALPPGAASPLPGTTRHGTVLGTPGYMAPEQERGDVDRIDARTDVYALGGLLRFLLTGVAPRDGADTAEPTRSPRPMPRRLDAICRKAQAIDPAARYASAAALAAEIVRFRAGEPIEAYREGPFERLGRVVRKYRVPILLVLAYLVMRVLLIWWGAT